MFRFEMQVVVTAFRHKKPAAAIPKLLGAFNHNKKLPSNPKLAILGIVVIAVSVAALVANPFQPLIRTSPKALISPVITEVYVDLYDARGNSVDASWDASKASIGVEWENQVGGNDCVYWTGDHLPGGVYRKHTQIGINSTKWFRWHNLGSGYDDFVIDVVRESNRDGFTTGGEEDAEILFSGGDYRALVTPSDGTASYTVPVTYNTYVWLDGDIWW